MIKSFVAEISRAEYQSALDVLPPLKWVYSGEIESFRAIDAVQADEHDSFVRIGRRYFRMCRSIEQSHAELVLEVTTHLATRSKRH